MFFQNSASRLLLTTLFSVFLLSACSSVPVDSGLEIEVYFCPSDDCESVLVSFIDGAVDCAFYDVSIPSVQIALSDSRVVMDRRNQNHFPSALVSRSSSLMHNKFCVKEGAVLTGSYNPTGSLLHNNVVIVHSAFLAANYNDEFDELWFGNRDKKVRYPVILYNNSTIESLFCPDDGCERRVLEVLSRANSSIRFALYSFTSDAIGDLLVAKHIMGVSISGIIGTRNPWDEFEKLGAAGIDLIYNRSIHDKVFIIDNRTVITGSYNPTGNGDRRNDENVLIISDNKIAEIFCFEFGC